MRKIIALSSLLGILTLSACAPATKPADTTTTDSTTTTTVTTSITDDTAWTDTTWDDEFPSVEDEDTDFIIEDTDGVVNDNINVDTDSNIDTDTDHEHTGTANPLCNCAEVIPTGNMSNVAFPQTGGADAEAEVLRQQVLNSETTTYNITGNTYYISYKGDDFNDGTSPETAWRTPDAIASNGYLIEEGDAILFERGGIYRRTTPIRVKSGVTYGAYGEGAKPAVYGSAYNYAWGKQWQPSNKKNVWKLTLYAGEAGMVIFDHGKEIGDRKMHGVDELKENGDFFHNTENATLYLYLDKGYPNVVYEDIEIGTAERVFNAPAETENVVIDNIAIKYSGYYAISTMGDAKNFTITNCEIGWIGGCRYSYSGSDTRLGNGIQFWESTSDVLVENCWVYQCYDTGISPQGIAGSTYKDIVLKDTLIEYCTYAFELFDRDPQHKWDGLVLEDNIFRFAGISWAGDRPDTYATSLICAWNINHTVPYGKGIAIKNNIFDVSNLNLIYWPSPSGVIPNLDTFVVSGNSFYQKANSTNTAITFLNYPTTTATNQAEFEASVRNFDPNPKVVKWLS